MQDLNDINLNITPVQAAIKAPFVANAEQQQAIDTALLRRSFCLIGAAGTGKTTTVKELVRNMEESHRLFPLERGTDNLQAGTPGIVFISFTNRAVRNLQKSLPKHLRSHAMTYHKLLEFGPEIYYEPNPAGGEPIAKMRFVPGRHHENPLPEKLLTIVVDEASMPSIELHQLLLDALPYPSQVQFIFLGDLNQLPPVYGDAILGKALLELPIVELVRVYRQALESPIVSLALGIKSNDFAVFNNDAKSGMFEVTSLAAGSKGKKVEGFDARNVTASVRIHREGNGTLYLHPWTRTLDMEDGLSAAKQKLRRMIADGDYDPEQDMVLCPWNKAFGNDELNRFVADWCGKQRGAEIFEVIAGFEKHYFAVGDRVVAEKQECRIVQIMRNTKYLGQPTLAASKTLNRWGHDSNAMLDESAIDVDAILEAAANSVLDKKNQCSHIITVQTDDGERIQLSTAGEVNAMYFGYCISVHKAQGSECRRVIFVTHGCHSKMLSRELAYTAITRAAQELHIVMTPKMLGTAATRPRIKGDTLAAKLEFFTARLQERIE